ncbi:hypothetical protein HZA33_03275 [Candidatus Pacearchaeota archaeon]|nr:hypothetical protein [Candidatus Pacearchaeota archaeon]
MGNFRSDRQGGFGDRSSGSRFGGRSRGFGRDSGRRAEMHDVICDKCGKQCQVPFRPTGDKPVFCSDCFKTTDGSRNRKQESGISAEQFNKINAKLDRIIRVLQDLELDTEDSDENSETDSKTK